MLALLEKIMQTNGAYSLPWLVKLWSDEPGGDEFPLLFVNSAYPVTYENEEYEASSFSYKPNASTMGFDGGGTLEIAARENGVLEGIEYFRGVRLDVTGILREADGTVQKVQAFKHSYGTIEGDFRTIRFTFDKDDRLTMTFPALQWNNFNNRGNA